MDLEALFQMSHGVYFTGAKDKSGRLVGSCIDSAMVVEINPVQLIVSFNKGSHTGHIVQQTGELTLSVLPKTTPATDIALFGTTSSKTEDKWAKVAHLMLDQLPVYADAVSFLSASAKQITETSEHFVFLCDVKDVRMNKPAPVLTYAMYQENQKQKKRPS